MHKNARMQWPQSWKETSIRNTCRMTGRSKGAVLSLLVELGCACSALHNCTVRNLNVRRLQADEIWSFVGAKNEECNARAEARGLGRCLDVDCNRCRHSSVSATYWGGRDAGWAHDFKQGLCIPHQWLRTGNDGLPSCISGRSGRCVRNGCRSRYVAQNLWHTLGRSN